MLEIVREICIHVLIYGFNLQIAIAEVMFCSHLKARKFGLPVFIIFIIGFALFPLLLENEYMFAPLVIFGWLNINFIIYFAISLLMMFLCFKLSIAHLLFFGLSAYAMQNLAYNCSHLLYDMSGLTPPADFVWITLLVGGCTSAVYVLMYFLFVSRVKRGENINIDNKRVIVMALVTIAIVFVMSSWVMFGETYYNMQSQIYASVCCLLTLIILFNFFAKSKEKKEIEKLEEIFQKEAQHHKLAQENIEIINLKCHDIKHQICAIRNKIENNAFDEEFKQIENSIEIYESVSKTGNEALDTVLMEKSLICNKDKIKVASIIDGQILNFLTAVDIYTLFGNLLENAIEALCKEPDTTKRILSLQVNRRKKFVCINIENYCAQRVEFVDGLPVTTKENKEYHGYGMKSILSICKKYNGNLNCKQEDDMMIIKILLPITNEPL